MARWVVDGRNGTGQPNKVPLFLWGPAEFAGFYPYTYRYYVPNNKTSCRPFIHRCSIRNRREQASRKGENSRGGVVSITPYRAEFYTGENAALTTGIYNI